MFSDDPIRLRFFGLDLRPRKKRRWLVVLTYSLFCGLFVVVMKYDYFGRDNFLGMGVAFALALFGIFALSWPIKAFDKEPIPPGGIVKGNRVLFALDDWSKYKYGDVLDALPFAKKQELLRFFSPDKYVSVSVSLFNPSLTSHDAIERNHASHKALRFLTFLLFFMAMMSFAYRYWTIHAGTVLLGLLLIAFTAPRAIILWSGPDLCDEDAVWELGEGQA